MSLLLRLQSKSRFYKLVLANNRHLSTNEDVTVNENDEYTKEPQYPPILDTTFGPTQRRKRLQWHEQIKCLNTVEEKLFSLNMPRYYGFKCVMLNDHIFRYNSLPFFQFTTRTAIIDKGLPEYYDKLNEKVDGLLLHVKADIEDAILFEYTGYNISNKSFAEDVDPQVKSRQQSARIVSQINRALINGLVADCPHLNETESDIDPRHEAFWFDGGIEPPEVIRKARANCWLKIIKDASNSSEYPPIFMSVPATNL